MEEAKPPVAWMLSPNAVTTKAGFGGTPLYLHPSTADFDRLVWMVASGHDFCKASGDMSVAEIAERIKRQIAALSAGA